MHSLQKNRGKVRVYEWAMNIANWLAALPARVTPPPFRLI